MDEQTAAQLYARAMGSRDDASEGFEEGQFETAFPSVVHDTTMQVSNVSTPEQRRERALTEESANTTGSNLSVSKQSLVRLMREQVDLVRSLTNAQIAQKKELEKVKAENKRLEELQKRGAAGYSQSQPPQQSTTSKSLNLPPRVNRDTSDSRSVSSRSFVRYFQRSPKTSRHQQTSHPYQHPDADYYYGSSRGGSPGNEDQTTANCDPSMASTILPTAIVIDAAKANTTGAFVDQFAPSYTGPGAYGGSKDKIEITRIPERNVVPENEHSCASKAWWLISRICTLFIPDFLLCCIGRHALVKKGMSKEEKKAVRATRREAKQAWREKVTIFMLMMFCCACFIGISGVIPMFLCRETTIFTMVSQ